MRCESLCPEVSLGYVPSLSGPYDGALQPAFTQVIGIHHMVTCEGGWGGGMMGVRQRKRDVEKKLGHTRDCGKNS